MGGGRGRDVSDPKPAEPDADLLEFLGGIDEVNDESKEDDFLDFLARADIDRLEGEKANDKAKEKVPVKEGKSE
jgi:hypothetical protein